MTLDHIHGPRSRHLSRRRMLFGAAASAVLLLGATDARALPDNATHHWTFDETAGPTAADSGTVGGANGTLGSAVMRINGNVGVGAVRVADNAQGDASSSVNFGNAVGQFGTADFSVTFSFRTTATQNQELLGNRTAPSGGNFFSLRTSGGSVIFEVDQDSAGTNQSGVGSGGGYADGNWHQVVATRHGAQLYLYVDGNRSGSTSSATAAANINNGNDLIAAYSPGVQPCCNTQFNGDLDDIRVYDYVLSDAQAGACNPDNCDDSNPCTDNSCDVTGCLYTNNQNSCDDGQICTTNDVCSNGTCAGTPVGLSNLDHGKCTGIVCGDGGNVCSVKDITVPDGATCTLMDVNVCHDVKVGKGSTLEMTGGSVGHDVHADGATNVGMVDVTGVGHDVSAKDTARFLVLRATIDHDVRADHCGGVSLGALTVGHDIHVEKNTGTVSVSGCSVGHDIHAEKNTGGTFISHDSYGGQLVCKGNTPPARGLCSN